MKAALLLSLNFVVAIFLAAVPTACSKEPDHSSQSNESNPSNKTMSKDTETAIIHTSEGDMTVEFWSDVAPKTVENFKKLAREGFYNGTAFHRIIKGFMIQGGDPNTKDPSKEALYGTGGPGYKIQAEFNDRSHQKGVLSMARSADPNSAGSQFFICDGNANFLDRQYTAFGKVVKGIDVLDKIASTPVTNNRGENSKPTKRIEIKKIDLVPAEQAQ